MNKDEMQNVQHLMKSYKIKKVIFDRVEVNFPFNCYDICQEEDSMECLYNLQNYLPIILAIYAVNVLQNYRGSPSCDDGFHSFFTEIVPP